MSYQGDREWSDAYIPALKAIVGPLLLTEASVERDTQEATDLIVLAGRDRQIGCRVRRPYDKRGRSYADMYPWEFTIRSQRDSGTTTEISKIIDGWCDCLVYAHAADSPHPTLARWFVLDLNIFRASLIRRSRLLPTLERQKPNGDGTHFMPYDIREFHTRLVIAASHRVPRAEAA